MKAFGRGLAGLSILALVIAAIEVQWVGYAASVLREGSSQGVSAADVSGTPADVIDAAFDRESATLTLLATGDIVACPEKSGFAKTLPATANLLGLPPAFDLTDVAASRIAELARSWPEAPVLAMGDLVYGSGTPVEFSDCFDPIWSSLRDRTLPAPGNHEYKSPDAFGYYDYWADRAGPDQRGYYLAEAGNWLILSLNSELEAGPGSDQGRWLKEALDAAPQACVLAFYHKPAFSLQKRDNRDNSVLLFQQLQHSGVTLVLNGHNHFYERTAPLAADGTIDDASGTMAFTVGTGGGRPSDEKPLTDTTEAAVFGSIGLLRLELASDGFRWWFHDAGNGEIVDKGEAPCNRSRGGRSWLALQYLINAPSRPAASSR